MTLKKIPFPRALQRGWLFGLTCGLAVAAAPAVAGTLCGTVRDALTLAPVEHAGVFLRLADWSYTGLHAASDAAGAWCIDNVPAGTYHLDVRVDDYRIGLVRDVVVTDSASGIDIAAQLPTTGIDAPWPNPAHGQVSFRLRLGAPGAATLAVYDVAGRRVRAWADADAVAGERTLDWDFRDAQGFEVPAGRYYLRLEAGGAVVTRPFVRVR
ncbi:MAG: carboxypeptidase regulatory-like domain-containing protein [bacterium]|nr:carboxypeptidase regulatory-like domain-containing protein [bacterium]